MYLSNFLKFLTFSVQQPDSYQPTNQKQTKWWQMMANLNWQFTMYR